MRSGIEPRKSSFYVTNSPTDSTTGDLAQRRDHRPIRPLAERRVEVDDGDVASETKAFGDGQRVSGVERLVTPADELDCVPVHQVNRWNNHGRTSAPKLVKATFTLPTVHSSS